jgi:hypothetical protein
MLTSRLMLPLFQRILPYTLQFPGKLPFFLFELRLQFPHPIRQIRRRIKFHDGNLRSSQHRILHRPDFTVEFVQHECPHVTQRNRPPARV